MIKHIRYAILILLIINACKGETMSGPKFTFKDLNEVPISTWENLAGKKIFFGHQSVGSNIMDGINDVIKDNPSIKLNVKETDQTVDISGGIFAHFPIGKNEDAGAKIQDFTLKMQQRIGDKADIAFFKFCFVDVTADTDVQKLFNLYQKALSSLKREYPHIAFVHVTVPLLKTNKAGIRTVMNKILGKSGGFFDNANNIKRNQYNDLLKKEYEGKEPLFDLAGFESAYPDGSRESFTQGGKMYYSLVPGYTEDGGHLNIEGRKRVAGQLLIFLAQLK